MKNIPDNPSAAVQKAQKRQKTEEVHESHRGIVDTSKNTPTVLPSGMDAAIQQIVAVTIPNIDILHNKSIFTSVEVNAAVYQKEMLF